MDKQATIEEASRASLLVADVIERWRSGESAAARPVLDRHPEVRARKSLVLDLIYEEFCLRLQRGEVIDRSDFCRRFPEVQASLARQLHVHDLLEAHPDLAAAAAETIWPRPGDVRCGFEILDDLGRGAFSRVYLASDLELGGRLVALKAGWQGAREARTAAKLAHPNIVPVLRAEDDSDSGLTLIAMPYVGRATLADVVDDIVGRRPADRSGATLIRAIQRANRGAAGLVGEAAGAVDHVFRVGSYEEAVVHVLAEVADALAFAHGRGVVHLDLKPSNILMTEQGHPLVADFNLAHNIGVEAPVVGGTLPYMAPEQLDELIQPSDDPGAIDARADVYALGVILFELLAGRLPCPLPFEAAGDLEAARMLRESQRRVEQCIRNAAFSDSIREALISALKEDRGSRCPNAAVLSQRLRSAVASARFATPTGKNTTLWRWRLASAAAGLALVLAGAASISVYNWIGAARATPRRRAIATETALGGSSSELLALAKREMAAHEYDAAFAVLKRLVEKDETAEAWRLLGDCSQQLGFYSDAVFATERAIRLDNGRVSDYVFLGECLLRLGAAARAVKVLDIALSVDPDDGTALCRRAEAWLKLAQLERRYPKEAERDVRRALALRESASAREIAARVEEYAAKFHASNDRDQAH